MSYPAYQTRGLPSGRLTRLLRRPASVAALASIGLAVCGFIWPWAADSLIRLLLAGIAIGFLAVAAVRAVTGIAHRRFDRSPFDEPDTVRASAVPGGLRRFARELSSAEASRRRMVPFAVRSAIRNEVRLRLSQNHGLALGDRKADGRIQALVSPPTWQLVRPQRPVVGRSYRYEQQPVPLDRLGQILDDVERL